MLNDEMSRRASVQIEIILIARSSSHFLNEESENEFVIDWVKNNAKRFDELWCNSKCKCCKMVYFCGFNLKPDCDYYINTGVS